MTETEGSTADRITTRRLVCVFRNILSLYNAIISLGQDVSRQSQYKRSKVSTVMSDRLQLSDSDTVSLALLTFHHLTWGWGALA